VTITGRDLWELIDNRVAATPDDEMLVDDAGQRVTFAEFQTRAEVMAAGLADLGLGADDNVSWQLPTWIDSVILAAALNRIGVVQNPILPIYREREVGFCTNQTGARFLIVPGVFRGFDFGKMAAAIAAGSESLEVLEVGPGSFPEGDPVTLPPAPDPATEPVRWICYTSGTTSDPKGARHTDASLAVIAENMSDRLGCVHGDRSVLAFPFTHIGGLGWLFAGLQFGMVSLTVEAFDPGPTVEFMAAENCTIAGSGTPFHQVYLNAQRQSPDAPILPDLKCCPGGGAPKPPQMHYDVKAELGGVGVVSGWGLTEAPILTMGAVTDADEKLAETEGRPMPGVDLRVVKLDGTTAGPGEEGELRAKAPQLMKGYLDSSLDADAFDEAGYFRTGDLGVQDDEGYVVITGRLKDVIIRHGENISAKEVEDLLYEHPAVGDIAVIGLPDDVTGERACAVVSAPEGAAPLAFAEMQEYLRGKGLRSQAIPEQLEHVEAVPRNPSGKILKQDLRDTYAAQPFNR
jgi:cyclohexanecarboxylate-CoA ligase